MIKAYDEAIINRIKKWTGDITFIQNRESLFTAIAQREGDKIKFPIIACRRTAPPQVLMVGKTWMSGDGYAIGETEDAQVAVLRAIPCRLSYGIAIFSTQREWADSMYQQFMWMMVNNPQIEVDIPTMERTTYCTMNIQREIDDSNIEEHLINGNIYAYEIEFTVDDAYLYSSREYDNIKIEGIDVNYGEKTETI